MDVQYVVSRLDEFGDAEVTELDDGEIVFELECEIGSLSELKDLTETLDNMYGSDLTITGQRYDALVVVRIDSDEFNEIPPYMYDGWVDASDDGY